MKRESIVAVVVGVIGVGLFTYLLITARLGETAYAYLLPLLALVCLVIHGFSRLREFDLKNWKLTLDRMETVKAEIERMYGGIENLRREPLLLDKEKMSYLGLNGGHFVLSAAVMRYTAGCLKRERERLARIFVNDKSPKERAQAILDASLDEKVFKWNGPETALDAEPKSVEQRERDKASDQPKE